mmetsp:Transcript_70259/g.121738  ORF Transcript_70259/g.121738 Transcript_70259/m.121738 type:complete len:174 (-) Transcript_70259:62-583(-)
MGTPSGSKNSNILSDRLDYLARTFEDRGDDIEVEKYYSSRAAKGERNVEKELKNAELQEFLSAKSDVRIEKKIGRIETVMPKGKDVGPRPAPQKRQLPGFVKLKSKEMDGDDDPQEKRPRTEANKGADGSSQGRAAGAAGSASTEAPALAATASTGSLVAYGSDSEDEDEDDA